MCGETYLHALHSSSLSNHTQPPANESLCSNPEDASNVPSYTLQGVWWVLWLVGVEYLVLWWQGARLPCLHENILSIAHATLYETTKLLVRGLEFGAYTWLWREYGFFPTPEDSLLTAALLVVLIDFGFYWFHRASHEIMVLWAIHQVHHSSQDLTVAVGLRHSPLQRLFSWVFYLPLALLGVSPATMLTHVQFSLLFQCWVHTETIPTLGPLEYIFNTPNHHKVHHGCNVYCLDKNYAGVFIIWDRLFGTFQAPRQEEKIVYGIVHQPEGFNLLYHQVFAMKTVLQKALDMDNLWDRLCALVKGPSWRPGAPWRGFDHEKLNIQAPREYMAAKATPTTHLYVFLHLLAAMTLTSRLTALTSWSPVEVFVYSLVVVAALTCIGILYEQPHYTRVLEAWRCVAGLLICFVLPPSTSLLPFLSALYTVSLAVWLLHPGLVLCHQHKKLE